MGSKNQIINYIYSCFAASASPMQASRETQPRPLPASTSTPTSTPTSTSTSTPTSTSTSASTSTLTVRQLLSSDQRNTNQSVIESAASSSRYPWENPSSSTSNVRASLDSVSISRFPWEENNTAADMDSTLRSESTEASIIVFFI